MLLVIFSILLSIFKMKNGGNVSFLAPALFPPSAFLRPGRKMLNVSPLLHSIDLVHQAIPSGYSSRAR
jgi:ABC-type polysaccharide/polyol phosphate export permease